MNYGKDFMNEEKIISLIKDCAKSFRLDPNLCLAIAEHESAFDPTRARFEPGWKYFVNTAKYAEQLRITEATERAQQAFSYNVFQVMGSVLRELGFNGALLLMIQPQLGVFYGCKKISMLSKKYPDEKDVISSFNQGGPYKEGELYKNQPYVDAVGKFLMEWRSK